METGSGLNRPSSGSDPPSLNRQLISASDLPSVSLLSSILVLISPSPGCSLGFSHSVFFVTGSFAPACVFLGGSQSGAWQRAEADWESKEENLISISNEAFSEGSQRPRKLREIHLFMDGFVKVLPQRLKSVQEANYVLD